MFRCMGVCDIAAFGPFFESKWRFKYHVEGSKKAAPLVTRLIAVAAVPVLSLLALSLTPHPTDSDASAAYVEPAEPAAGDVTVLAPRRSF